jgi:hypothetical protein
MRMELAPRLNLITGDNGLGKSFLLDVAWWAISRRWPIEIDRVRGRVEERRRGVHDSHPGRNTVEGELVSIPHRGRRPSRG